MKTIITAALIALGTSAAAERIHFNAGSEYSLESESVSLSAGADYTVTYLLPFTVAANANMSSDLEEFSFDGVDIGVSVPVGSYATVYSKVEFTDEFEYDEFVVGTSVRF